MIKGIFIGFGFSIGLVTSVFILLLIIKTIKKSEKYKTKDLIKAAKKYKVKLINIEEYEHIKLVDKAIDELKNGNSKDLTSKFEIKQKNSLKLKHDTIKVIKKIKILGLKKQKDESKN